MNSSITIPKTIEAAKTALGAVGALLTAKHWERAAIVYAFTDPKVNQHDGNPSGSLSIAAFTALGITGLTNRETVAEYRKAWQSAIDSGDASAVKPGDTITLPSLDWPPGFINHRRGSHGTEAEARALIVRNPQVAVEAMKAVPAVADAVTTAIVHSNDLHNEVERKAFAKTMGHKDKGKFATPTIIPTFEREKELAKAITVVTKAIEDEESGAWTPDSMSVAMLTILYLNLKSRADRIVAAQPVVHGEIDAFLRDSSKAKE